MRFLFPSDGNIFHQLGFPLSTGTAGQRWNDELFSLERLPGTKDPDPSVLLVNTETSQGGCETLRFVPLLLMPSKSAPTGAGR